MLKLNIPVCHSWQIKTFITKVTSACCFFYGQGFVLITEKLAFCVFSIIWEMFSLFVMDGMTIQRAVDHLHAVICKLTKSYT